MPMRPRSGRHHAAPQEIVVQFFGRRRLERIHLAALRIDARHDVLDGAVLAGRVHRLEDQQHRPAVVGVESILQFGQPDHAAFHQVLGGFSPGSIYPPVSAGSWSARRNFLPLVIRYGAMNSAMVGGMAAPDSGRRISQRSLPILTAGHHWGLMIAAKRP